MFNEICENLRKIDKAINEVERVLKENISKNNESMVDTYTKIYSYLVTCWTEVRVLKLANEHYAFTPDEKTTIISARTLQEKWTTALNIGFCKSFNLQNINDRSKLMEEEDLIKYDKLLSLIENELKIAILVRNKVTHGQWIHPLNSKNTSLNNDIKIIMQKENYLLIRLRANIFTALTNLIHYLGVSGVTFKRDYDKYLNQINQYIEVYNKQGYDKFKMNMIQKYERGQLKRVKSTVSNKI